MVNSIIDFPSEYVMLDTETTGFSVEWDSMIEIGALKVRNGEIIDTFETFVKLDEELPEFITELTGITDAMLIDAPAPQEAVKAFLDFLGDDMIVGYNVKFDINFIQEDLKRYFGQEMNNDYIDCMRIARKLFPDEKHHRLKDMRKLFGIIADKEHRASHDCIATKAVFEKLREVAIDKYGSIEDFKKAFGYKGLKASDISAQNSSFDVTHILFGMTCVFTGTLEKMTRREAMQAVVDIGGIVGDNVTKDTNFLILGNNDYCKTIKDGKSTKQKKAESLMLKGNDIAIIPENVFYEMLES
ncbi:exonuclease domain-containing protein [uncultured Ruminococcus sp.]|uniref:exonuclease domain-containing protein n=1 Tax=uncultured Ruminococcus sp. TaxID=165186 RepID=UPI0025EB494A|nr:exonuclease domain-containing protein [uncultured Ruminococcus sp.]